MARFANAAAHLLSLLLMVIQLLLLSGGAFLVAARFPFGFEGTVPWYGPVVKIAGAIVIAAVSFYICRAAVRALGTGNGGPERRLGTVHHLEHYCRCLPDGAGLCRLLLFSDMGAW
jgi:hypothetical protein